MHTKKKNDAPTIIAFGILMLCDVRNANSTIEKSLTSYTYQLITNNKRFNERSNIRQSKS